jgi:hypothetical protein
MTDAPAPIIDNSIDNGGRRLGIDLRQFSYTGHIPERRASRDRRSRPDRRVSIERRTCADRRTSLTPEKKPAGKAEIIEMRSHKERRGGPDRRLAFG